MTASAKGPDEMTEAELADYYYAQRDDLAGEEVPSRRPSRMDVMISVRFSQAEAVELRAAASRARTSVSAFLRQRVLADLHTKVIDLDRVRADVEDMRARAAKVLLVLNATARKAASGEKATGKRTAAKKAAGKEQPARKTRKSA